MQDAPPPSQDIFQPSRRRALAAVTLAAIGFLLPQEVPLEWYPRNHPGTDIQYLEIACASNKNGTVQIFYDTTKGFNQLECIRWPISPTAQTYTYTFPLPDAPITALRFDPVGDGGTLTIRQMRIINRRGEEIRRFTRDMFAPTNHIAAISPAPDGWTITSMAGSTDPFARIELRSPILPVGINGRNLQRCLLSTGYLALMLWILLLAVLFIFHRPRSWRELVPRLAFLAGLALLFALVGNRGLIRSSVRFARYHPPALALADPKPVINLRTAIPGTSAQLFFDSDRKNWQTGRVLLVDEAALTTVAADLIL